MHVSVDRCAMQRLQPRKLRHTTLWVQVTAQQASEVQPGQTLPTLALPNGTDAAQPLAGMSAQAAAVAQAQSTLSGGGPPQSLSLGGPSDMQMCQELGLLPTSPLSTGGANGNGHNGAAALAAAAALPPLLQAQPTVVQPASLLPAQPAAAAVAAQAPMAVAQQVVTGGAGLQVLSGQQQTVGGTLVTGTAVVNMQHTTLPTSQVGMVVDAVGRTPRPPTNHPASPVKDSKCCRLAIPLSAVGWRLNLQPLGHH